MNVPVVMPQLGLTMTEGSVSEWLKKPGDLVRKGDMLFVVSTDKADMEVESLDEGTLAQIVVEPGNVVPVGTVIAYLGGSDNLAVSQAPVTQATVAPPLQAPGKMSEAPIQTPPLAPLRTLSTMETLPASPRARKIARELGVDISQVTPRVGSGRIVEEDVRRFAETAKPAVAKVAPPDLRRRHLIADRLTKSIQTIPHFSVSVEVRADELVSLRASLNSAAQNQAPLKITVTDLLLKALGLALQESPAMMMVWDDGNYRTAAQIDLGLAIAAERGVVAPVIRNVGALDLAAIARWRQASIEKERGGRLALTDLEGGIGTLSNLGIFRVDHFQAIITPGQSFILAVGKIAPRPWVDAGALVVAQTLALTLSVDHRVADGAMAAQFLERIAEIIENPRRLLDEPANSKPTQ